MKLNRNKIIVVVLVLVLSIAGTILFSRMTAPSKHGTSLSEHKHGENTIYQCPMHPQIIQDHPGKCPICHMDLQKMENQSNPSKIDATNSKNQKPLYYRHPMNPSITSQAPAKDDMGMDFIPVYEQGGESRIPGRAAIDMTLYKQQLIGVKLGEAKKQNLEKTIYTVGRIAFDPMLYQAQEEYLAALKAYQASSESPVPGADARAEQLLEASRFKLRLSGLSDKQIEELANTQNADESLLLASDSGQVWLYAEIYEQDLSFVKAGQTVEVMVPAEPGKTYEGVILAIDPVLDMKTRTARIRAQITTKEKTLRPGMYANAKIKADMGEALVIPRSAVLFTGKRNIVFLAKGEGRFEPRDIKIGMRAENTLQVVEGLHKGDKIAVSGNFLIDAESQLFGSASGGAFYSGREAAEETSKKEGVS